MLDEPLTCLKGLGPQRAKALEIRFGLSRVRDLLELAPRGYGQRVRRMARAEEIVPGAEVAIEAKLTSWTSRRGQRGIHVTTAQLEVEGAPRLEARIYNQRWLAQKWSRGDTLRWSGVVQKGRPLRLDKARLLDEEDLPAAHRGLKPRYPRVAEVPPRSLRRWIGQALEAMGSVEAPSLVPTELERSLELPGLASAWRFVHEPADAAQAEAGRRRLALEELCRLRLRVGGPPRPAGAPRPLHVDDALEERIRKRIPFQPTADQARAMAAVRADIAGKKPMARLLVGDVGTGKTAVAFYALLAAVGQAQQGLLLAPTEALARQHFQSLRAWLRGSRVRVELVLGGMPAARRRAIRKGCADGTIDVLIGTHALLRLPRPKRAGLVVIDEQHRFGTKQKTRLYERTGAAHVLSMSATPIPRTWVHALWGNLEVSWLEERPPGRRPVETRILARTERDRALQGLRESLDRGGQALWICPRVRRGEQGGPAAVESARDAVAAALPGRRVAALHGKAGAERVAATIEAFRSGRLDLLVASSLIEVGMDFPEASYLVVEDADRFGLVQLHQLRGRIGRGQREACAVLLARGEEIPERLEFLAEVADGKLVAARDLELRGPGELLGLRQHGWRKGRFFAGRKDFDLLNAVSSWVPPG